MKIIKELALRLSEIGINQRNVGKDGQLPDEAIGMVAIGQARLVVIRGPDLCPCCGKLQIRAFIMKPSKKPLEEIFR